MRAHYLTRTLAAATACLMALGCEDPYGPGEPSRLPTPNVNVAALQVRTLDAEFEQLAGRIPGFGGFFFDGSGRLTVFLTDPARRVLAVQVLTEHLAGRSVFLPGNAGLDVANLAVLRGNYDFAQLLAWRRQLERARASTPDVVYWDVDETINKVVVVVMNENSGQRVLDVAARLAIPSDAVKTAVGGRVEPHDNANLRDRWRPLIPGGVITDAGDFRGSCSIGYNVALPSGSDRYFVTASHCSQGRFSEGPDGSWYTQPNTIEPGSLIGEEWADRGFYYRGPECAAAGGCRFSDASLNRYFTASQADLGWVARPIDSSATWGSIVTSGWFQITATQGYPFTGETVHKVGQRTGWTYGSIGQSCMTLWWSVVNNQDLLCMYSATYGSDAGDSGAPVFHRLPEQFGGISVVGIHHGKHAEFSGNWFSPWEGVRLDLGQLIAFF